MPVLGGACAARRGGHWPRGCATRPPGPSSRATGSTGPCGCAGPGRGAAPPDVGCGAARSGRRRGDAGWTRPVRAGGAGSGSSTENATCHRPRCQDRVAERIRAVPASILRARPRVDSWVRTWPIRGSWTWRRSAPSPKAPVVKRQLSRARRPLNRGNPTRRPARRPDFEVDQVDRAVARLASPAEYG